MGEEMNWEYFLLGACAPFVLMAVFLCVSNIFKWCVYAVLKDEIKTMRRQQETIEGLAWHMQKHGDCIEALSTKEIKKKSR